MSLELLDDSCPELLGVVLQLVGDREELVGIFPGLFETSLLTFFLFQEFAATLLQKNLLLVCALLL